MSTCTSRCEENELSGKPGGSMNVFSNKLLIIGLGSMGRRRARLTKRFFPAVALAGLDSQEDRRAHFAREYDAAVFRSLEEAIKSFAPGAAAVCTSPEQHGELVLRLMRDGIPTFSELDLVEDCYDEIISIEERGVPVSFLSSTMLFRSENRWITQHHVMAGKATDRFTDTAANLKAIGNPARLCGKRR